MLSYFVNSHRLYKRTGLRLAQKAEVDLINSLPANPHKVAYAREQHLIRFKRYALSELAARESDLSDMHVIAASRAMTIDHKELELRKHVDTINRLADEVTQRKHTVVALSNEMLEYKESVGHYKWTADHQRAHAEDLWKRLQKAESNTSNILAVAAPFMGVAILLLVAFLAIDFTEARRLRRQLDEVAPTLVCEAP